MERFIPFMTVVGWFGLVFGASYLINWLLIRSIIRRWYRIFVGPGVIVHELSHAAGCLITGCQITEINFWKASGGHVKHYQPRDPFVRMVSEPIIALAPIGGTFLVLGFITWLFYPQLFSYFVSAKYEAVLNIFEWADWQTWLYLYLTTSLLATIAPSKTDMTYAFGSLVVAAVAFIGLSFLPGFTETLIRLGERFIPFAIFTLLLMITGVIIAFILAIPNRDKQFVAREQIE